MLIDKDTTIRTTMVHEPKTTRLQNQFSRYNIGSGRGSSFKLVRPAFLVAGEHSPRRRVTRPQQEQQGR